MVDRLIAILQISKSSLQPGLKEKLPQYEKQLFNLINSNRRRNSGQQIQGQQQFPQSTGGNQSIQPQPSSPAPLQQRDPHGTQMPPLVVQSSVTPLQSTVGSTIPMSTHVQNISNSTQHNMMNAFQSGSTPIESSQGTTLTSMQDGGLGSFQQTTFGSSTQSNMHTLTQSSTLQHVKQEHPYQQLMQSQQMKQQIQQQRQMQHQKPQILQPQLQQQFQQLQQPKQQQSSQMPQLHHMNEMTDLKSRQSSLKPGLYQPNFTGSQRQPFHQHQQIKPGVSASFPISSPQNLQVPSPQISQHSSPQIDQSLLPTIPKTGTPLQSSSSPFVVPSPSTPLAPSPLPGDLEKPLSSFSSLSNAPNVLHQQAPVAPTLTQSMTVSTPGISASPLLAEYISPDGGHAAAPVFSTKPTVTEKPIDRLVKAVSPFNLRFSRSEK